MSAHTIANEATAMVTDFSRAVGRNVGRGRADSLVRDLPLRTAILDGEGLDSWIEALARRHRLGLRSLLPALGITQTTSSTFRLVYGIDPRVLRRLEQVTAFAAGRLDSAVGGPVAAAHRLRSGGTRYCPRCLADTSGRWQLSWRLRWTVACQRHRLLLLDSCPTCTATPRIRISGVTPPLPPGTCTHTITPRQRRCGTDLTTAAASPASDDVLDVQRWVDNLIGAASHHQVRHRHVGQDTAGEVAVVVLANLPVVVSWLLHSNHDTLIAAASRINPNRPTHRDDQPGAQRLHGSDTALTVAALTQARTIVDSSVDSSGQAAVTVLHAILSELPTPRRVPPPGMSATFWRTLSEGSSGGCNTLVG